MLNKFVTTLFLIAVLASCNLLTWEYIDISCTVEQNQDYCLDEYVGIIFSIEPDKAEIERKIGFLAGNSTVPVKGHWTDKTYFIKPETSWQKGELYSINLEGSFTMADGRSYTIYLYRKFIHGKKNKDFELQAHNFAGDYLELVFNKPVQITSFNDNFTLTPSIDRNVNFLDGNKRVRITPGNKWSVNAIYAWSVRKLISHDGYLMQKNHSGTFVYGVDTVLPLLEQICPVTYDAGNSIWHTAQNLDGNLMEKQAIGFIFSKDMDEGSIKSGITFNPNINGYFIKETERKFIFVPEAYYQLKRNYRLTISNSIVDSSGLSLYEGKTEYFTTINDYITVDSVIFDNTNSMLTDGTMNDYALQSGVLWVDIYFSTSIPETYRKKAVDSVSMSVLFPDSASPASLLSARWTEPGFILTLTYDGFTKSTTAITNYYLLKILGGTNGIKNEAEEYMQEDVCVNFKLLP
ncbi:MAG: Ig-like domain-containing protein [Treponema sp.]|jgi:hypothetical protein|nr:Ig-like domain-containing protein [Treponema sp.]